MRKLIGRLIISSVLLMALLPMQLLAQEKNEPRVFVEITGGAGLYDSDKNYGFAQFSPTAGVVFNGRFAVGIRETFQTNYALLGFHYNVATLYGQYTFWRHNRLSIFVEGKGSFYNYVCSNSDFNVVKDYGEIGFSLGGSLSVTEHLDIVMHYLYAGVELGGNRHNLKNRIKSYKGTLMAERFLADFGLQRLQIGGRYTF